MTLGYELPEPNADAADPWSGFSWELGDVYNIATVAVSGAGDDASRTALRHEARDGSRTTVSYAQLDEGSDELAARLVQMGIETGDRVGVCLPQCPESLVTQLAVFKAGGTVVPLSMLLGRDSFQYVLDHSGASLLVVDDERREEGAPLPTSVETLPVSIGGYDRSPLGGLADEVEGGASVETGDTAPRDPALVMYTSGTTGKPKGVVQGHQYLAGSLPGYQAWFELFDESDARSARVWTPSEWAWAGALFDVVFPTLAVGGCVVSRERRSGFNPDDALALVERDRVSHTFMPATALQQIRSEASPGEYDTSTLQVAMSGGEKLPAGLLTWIENHLAPVVHETYGQTEANALVGNCHAAYPVKPGSMGRPYPGHDVVVVDETGEEVGEGAIGEIAIRLPDPVVFLGYHEDDAATAEKFRDGLFLTGDLATRDEDGYLWHRGRKDDLILTAGYRVSPLEVEEALESLDQVADAVVGGVPDQERGQRVKAFVKLASDVEPDDGVADALRDGVGSILGRHKVPREVEFVDAIPETRTGKADRNALFDA